MIPHQWYAICESRQLKKRPIGLHRLGQRFVLWRDSNGNPNCMDDRCAHRGVALSLGKVAGDTIQCRYHGLQYNCEGSCVRVPSAPDDAPISKALKIRHWPIREENGLVWLFWGEPGREPENVPWIEDIPKDPRVCIGRSEVWPFNHVRILENNLDVHHWAFIHDNIMLGVGDYFDKYEVEVDGDLIRSWGTLRLTNRRLRKHGSPWEFRVYQKMPNHSMIQVTPHFRSLVVVTPVDEYRSWVHIRCYQTYARFPIGRFLLDHYCINFLYSVPQYLQDFPVFQNQNPRYTGLGVNKLIAADRAIGEYLKLRRKMLRDAGIEDDCSIPLIRQGHPQCEPSSNGQAGSNGHVPAMVPSRESGDLGADSRGFRRARDQGTQGRWGRAWSWMTALCAYPLLGPSTIGSHVINTFAGRNLQTKVTSNGRTSDHSAAAASEPQQQTET